MPTTTSTTTIMMIRWIHCRYRSWFFPCCYPNKDSSGFSSMSVTSTSQLVVVENVRKNNLRKKTQYQDVHEFIKDGNNVYVGRSNKHCHLNFASIFQNPFPILHLPFLSYKEVETAVLAMFLNYFLQDEMMIRQLHLLKNKTLGKDYVRWCRWLKLYQQQILWHFFLAGCWCKRSTKNDDFYDLTLTKWTFWCHGQLLNYYKRVLSGNLRQFYKFSLNHWDFDGTPVHIFNLLPIFKITNTMYRIFFVFFLVFFRIIYNLLKNSKRWLFTFFHHLPKLVNLKRAVVLLVVVFHASKEYSIKDHLLLNIPIYIATREPWVDFISHNCSRWTDVWKGGERRKKVVGEMSLIVLPNDVCYFFFFFIIPKKTPITNMSFMNIEQWYWQSTFSFLIISHYRLSCRSTGLLSRR